MFFWGDVRGVGCDAVPACASWWAGFAWSMRWFLLFVILVFPVCGESTRIRGLAWPALSPDGGTVVFEWLNDLWLAPAGGGEARVLVRDRVRKAYPQFCPTGERVFFGSEASGSVQLHSVGLDGGDLRVHTRHGEGNILEGISADGRHALVRGLRERSGYRAFRLMLVDLHDERRERRLFDATGHSVSISPDGGRYLFCRGGEQLYRKGHRGPRASSIHLFEAGGGGFSVEVAEDAGARSPMWLPDGTGFYYVSSRNGAFNVWKRVFDALGGDVQLTFFEDDGVILPGLSANGEAMVFRVGQSVWLMNPASGEAPREVIFYAAENVPDRSMRRERVRGASHADIADDGRFAVFSAAGDLWMAREGKDAPVRLTATDGLDELEPVLAADGERVFYFRDDGVKMEVVEAGFDGGELGDSRVIFSDERWKRRLSMSPDGRRLAWIEAPGDLVTAGVDGGGKQVVLAGWDAPTFDWSPCGRWLVVAAKDRHSNRDIFLVDSVGGRVVFNLTRHPAFEGSPKWSPDGRWIVFTARRDEDGLARLWMVDLGRGGLPEEVDEVLLERISLGIRPLDVELSEPTRVLWTHDSKGVLFQSKDAGDRMVYRIDVADGEVSPFLEGRGVPIRMTAEGRLMWRVGRQPVWRDGENEVVFGFDFAVEQDRESRMRLGFRRIWRVLGERFYDEEMNGREWKAVLKKYEDAASFSMDSRQFDRVVAQLLGELNASHLTFKTRPWGVGSVALKSADKTAHPGMVFEDGDGPLRVKRVIAGTPVAGLSGAPVGGELVKRLAGVEVDSATALERFFNGAEGRVVPMVVEGVDGRLRTLELRPVSYDRVRLLDRVERERDAEDQVEGIRYLPVRRMRREDFRDLATEVYRASIDAEGIVLDLRDNGGGRVADELLALFSQPAHSITMPRNGPLGYPVDRRVLPSWDGPLVVLCNENTYSNAEIFCHAVQHSGRAELVGKRTNGGVISAVSVTIPQMGDLQVPFRGWFRIDTGADLEMNGARPDFEVEQGPLHEHEGSDPQLEEALGLLRRRIGEQVETPEAVIRRR